MNAHFEELIESYVTNKVGIDTEFLSEALVKGLREHLGGLNNSGTMIQAGVGNDHERRSQAFRSDKIFWLDKQSKNSAELEFLDQVDQFIDHLNSSCYTGINSYEFHYAVYEQGTSYKRHKDQFSNNTERKYSMVSYLNDNWLDSDGGQLNIYHGSDTQSINPDSRKAVFFESAEMEHEVLVATRQRLSVTGWLKRV